ncbi:MAG: pyridoxamine 5'-phosphate oxidase family protein [Syntrophobacterales bacterium]
MLDKMKDVIRSQDMCVLATVKGNKPHCSLMAYVTDEECRIIYMITHKNTAKYRNLTANPSLSLLIDTRLMDRGEDRQRAKALTVNGVFERIEDSDKRSNILAKFVESHVHLKEFAGHPDAEILAVRIQSLQLLDGVTDAYYETLE